MNYRRLFVPNSTVFITIVTSKRREILIDNIDLLRQSFVIAKDKFSFEIVAICVLKDHLHLLLKPNIIEDYPIIIKTIKSQFSKNFDTNTINNYQESSSRISKGEKDIWQRRYWEHTIINEEDLFKHIDYIHYNPMKHYSIAPKNWQFSSFYKFVKQKYYYEDWCNFGDKHNICRLNYE